MTALIDLTGTRVGRLTVLERAGVEANGAATWHCRCDCGTELIRRGDVLGAALHRGRDSACDACPKTSARASRRHQITAENYLRTTVGRLVSFRELQEALELPASAIQITVERLVDSGRLVTQRVHPNHTRYRWVPETANDVARKHLRLIAPGRMLPQPGERLHCDHEADCLQVFDRIHPTADAASCPANCNAFTPENRQAPNGYGEHPLARAQRLFGEGE